MKSLVLSVVRVAAAILVSAHVMSAVAAAQPSADLEIQKYTFTDPAAAGAPLTYSIFLFNVGPDDAHDVVVTDVLQAGATFGSVTTFPESDACAFDAPSHTLTCNLGDVVAFDGFFIDLVVTAPPSSGTLVNTATVASSTPDPNPDNNAFTVSTPVVVFSVSDLAVTMTASAEMVLVHRAVTFTTTVTNLGPQDAAAVRVSLSPPSLANIISLTPSQGACEATIDQIDCLLGPLAAGASATIALEVKPQKDGFALTSAFVSGDGDPLFFDPDIQNDFAHVSVDVNYPGNADPSFATTTSQTVPYATYVANPCTEDIIYLSGTVHQVVSLTLNPNRFRTNTSTHYQGLTGIGLFTGTTYRASGGSRTGTGLSLVFNGLYPREVTIVDDFRLVGGGETLLLHQNTHFTINANGTFTAVVDNPRLECK